MNLLIIFNLSNWLAILTNIGTLLLLKKAGQIVREQFVYDMLRSNRHWSSMRQFDQNHSKWHIRYVGGTARAENLKNLPK
jgi:hypothetical protein